MAAVFIGGAELAACYWLDPPIFHKIVDPVVEKSGDLWRFTSDQVRVAADGVKQRIAERSALRQEQIESQRAGEPTIPDGGVMKEDPAITGDSGWSGGADGRVGFDCVFCAKRSGMERSALWL